jgi:GntP family gluconate:H+ symporter
MLEFYHSHAWPFVVLIVCMALIIFQITFLRIHAFLALFIAAVTAGLMAVTLEGEPEKSHLLQAVELTTQEFGHTCGIIGISIALASIISECLMESGAADKVVRRFIAAAGNERVGLALLWSTYILSVPIFFDTMFMLMVPLAKALRLRNGKDYLLYIMAICCGGVVTHSMTVPHPGPIAMVDNLHLDVGASIGAGIVVGLVPAIVGWFVCKWLNSKLEIPLRETPGASIASLQSIADKPESELPGFVESITPVLLPVALITGASFFAVLHRAGKMPAMPAAIPTLIEFIGNKNIALLIGAFMAVLLLKKRKNLSMDKVCAVLTPPLETAGIMILITAAGGSFGFMLRNAGVGEAIKAYSANAHINMILLSYFVALTIRIAQGSATVAMLTTSSIVYPLISAPGALPFNMMYIYLSIGFGAIGCSWMNDSGFWIVNRLSGMTEKETLKTWTVLLTVISVTGLAMTLLLSYALPLAKVH